MKITMITLGSTGDVRPYMLLGRELHERGHEVTIAAFAPFQGMIEEAGMSFYPISGDVVDMMGRLLQPDAVGVRYFKEFEKGIRDIAPMLLDDLLHCAEGAEAIVCTFFGTMFYSIAEKYDIPCIQTQYFPMDPCKDMPISSAPFRKLGKWWNVLSYRIGYLLISALEHRYLSDWRKENDMAKRRVRLRPDYDVKGKQVPVIYAMSPTLVPRPEDWADNIHMSGFWWDERPVDYTPDPALAEFLRAGDEPVYIGFGSMVSGDMGELAEIIRQAVKLSGVRAVVALGWGQQEAKTKDANIFYVKSVPHDWLFPHMAGAVHHGGAGTTATSLRHALPTLVVPFGGDQPFWAERVYAAGCGPKAIPRDKLTAENLAEGLRALISNPEYTRNAACIGEALRNEHGCVNAADLIEKAVWDWENGNPAQDGINI